MTEEARRLFDSAIWKLSKAQDQRMDKLLDALLRETGSAEEIERKFAYLLEHVSFRLTEKDLNDMMEEAMDREKRLRKFERGNARPS